MNKEFFKNKKVLVTGGAGFIGSWLVKRLVELESEVYVADNLSRGRIENIQPLLDEIQFYKIDLTIFDNCIKATQGIEYVFHLAASVGGIPYLKKANVEGLTPSLLMNANILKASVINGVKRFLFTSSACIYQEKEGILNRFKEEDAYPAKPLTTYGWAKIMGEILCSSYSSDYGIKTSSVRIFNAYGEHENLDPQWSHVIPSLIRKAILYPKEGFRILGDGKQERGFLYVEDCVDGILLAIERIEDGTPVNLGNDRLFSIKEVAEKVIKISGKDIKLEYDLSGTQGTKKYCADTTLMQKLLGWKPKVPLEEGLRRTYKWAESVLK